MPDLLLDPRFIQQLERLAVLYRRAAAGPLQGERRSPKRGQSVEFADFRPYVAGDDIRRIDWNAYARLERYFIKLFVEEQDLTVHFLIDASRSMRWGEPDKLTYAVKATAALAYVALVGQDRVEVTALSETRLPGNGRFLPSRGKRSAVPLFNFLSAISSQQSAPERSPGQATSYQQLSLPQALNSYAAILPNPGPLLVLSDLMDDGWQPALNHLASRGFEISLLHILSPDEVVPDLAGDFRLVDSESGAGVELTADFETLARYRSLLAGWQDDWRRFCSARSMHYASLATDLPLEELLFARLQQQGVLR